MSLENVIELLKNLKLKFEDDKLAGTKAETNAINSYDLAKDSRDNAIAAAEKSKGKKEKSLGVCKKNIADATKDFTSPLCLSSRVGLNKQGPARV